MIKLNLSDEQLSELHGEAMKNVCPRARKKCWVVYLRGKGFSNVVIADLVKVDVDSVTNYVKKYQAGGLPLLLKEDYRKPKGRMDDYQEQLKRLFKAHPPRTVNEAIEMIERETGISLAPSTCRDVLKKLGLRFRRCGLVPGKALEDEKHHQRQSEFHANKLQPALEEAQKGARIVLLVDAAHFVMGAFLGMLWSFTRLLLPSSSGRKRYNVLGAYNPITHEVITITNDTVVNQETFCEILEKVASVYAKAKKPITLILDNARYQKCKSVFAKAQELGIQLLYLPPYSPNLNLIERLWRFVKKKVLYSKHYDDFFSFKTSIDECLSALHTRFFDAMRTLMTLKFQFFSKSEKMTA